MERDAQAYTSYLVLREDVSDEHFYAFVHKHDLKFLDQSTPAEGHAFQLTYGVPNEDAVIRYVLDPVLQVPALLFYGAQTTRIHGVAQREFDVVDTDEIRRMFAESATAEEKVRSLRYTALAAAADHGPWIRAPLEQAVAHADPVVRRWALIVLRYAADKTLNKLAERMASTDPDPTVRDEAARYLAAFQAYKSEKSVS